MFSKMGLASLILGDQNPFAQYVAQNKNTIHNAFAGFGQGTSFGDGLSRAALGAASGNPADEVAAKNAKDERDRQNAINLTAKYLASNPAFADLVPLAQSGQGATALAEAFRRSAAQQKAAPEPFTLNQGDTRYAGDGSVLASSPAAPVKPAVPPSGYRSTQDGTGLEFVPGGPADPSTAAKTTEATRRNQQLATVITPELAALIGDGNNPGTFDALSDAGNQVWNGMGVGNFLASPQYQQAQNSLKTIVASYLYSVSGATANPGEVQNQVDVLTPKPGESAQSIAAKKARLIQMVEAVKAAATGRPINIDDPAATGQPKGNTTSTGVQWSIEP